MLYMGKLTVAFDVDDTLIVPRVATGFDRETPNYETISLFRWFQSQGNRMIIWSGSGCDWAKAWAEKLGLECEIHRKGSIPVDIAFDDCDVKLGTVNVKVSRTNNQISRADWNREKR